MCVSGEHRYVKRTDGFVCAAERMLMWTGESACVLLLWRPLTCRRYAFGPIIEEEDEEDGFVLCACRWYTVHEYVPAGIGSHGVELVPRLSQVRSTRCSIVASCYVGSSPQPTSTPPRRSCRFMRSVACVVLCRIRIFSATQ